MADKINGIYEPFADHVVKQLNHRREILQGSFILSGSADFDPEANSFKRFSNSKKFHAYTTEKQCTIRMVSGVDLRKDGATKDFLEPHENYYINEGAARQYILESGTRFYNQEGGFDGLREGFTSGRGKKSIDPNNPDPNKTPEDLTDDLRLEDDFRGFTYGDRNIRADEGDGFGVVPMPGIIDAEIRTRTPEGSLREAKVNFRCYNRRQLEILEMLYMRPGYPILLEWGWNPYVLSDNDNPEINTSTVIKDFLKSDNNKSNLDLLNTKIKELKILAEGNYDGFIGYCKNFDFKALDDGGYQCSTEIIAHGEILESLKSLTVNVTTGTNPDGSRQLEVKDAFMHYLEAIKHNTNKLGELAYLQWSGSDREIVTGGRRKYIIDLEAPDEEALTESELNALTAQGTLEAFEKLKNKILDITKITSEGTDGLDMKNFGREDGLGIRSKMGGMIVKQVTRGDRNDTNGDSIINIRRETGYKKFIYVRWDLICQIINQFSIEKYSKEKPIVELSYLGNDQIIYSTTNTTKTPGAHQNGHTGTSKPYYIEYTPPFVDSCDPIYKPTNSAFANGKRYHPLLGISYDPRVCLLPHQALFDGLYESGKTKYDPHFVPATVLETNPPGPNQKHTVFPYESDEKIESQQVEEDAKDLHLTSWNNTIHKRHSIGKIYFSLDYLLETYEDLRTEKITDTDYHGNEIESIRLKQDFYLIDFIKKIWDDVNESCAGFYKFQIRSEHERPNVIKIIEATFRGDFEDDKIFEFQPQGISSIVRSFFFNSQISNDIASVISIAAQAPNDVSSLEEVSFRAFHRNIKNRFSDADKILPDGSAKLTDEEKSKAKKQLEDDIKEYNLQLKNLKYFVEKLNKGNWETRIKTYGAYADSTASQQNLISYDTAKRYAKEIEKLKYSIDLRYPRFKEDGTTPHPKAGIYRKDTGLDRNAIIPLTANILLDGIASLNPLNVFRIKKDRLPFAYDGDHILFIIKSETQKITSNQDWTTEISGQLTLRNTMDKTYDVCLNPLPEGSDSHVLDQSEGYGTVQETSDENNNNEDEENENCPRLEGSSTITGAKTGGPGINWGNPLPVKLRVNSPWGRERGPHLLTTPGDSDSCPSGDICSGKPRRHGGLDLGMPQSGPPSSNAPKDFHVLSPGFGMVVQHIDDDFCGIGLKIRHFSENFQNSASQCNIFLNLRPIPVMTTFCHLKKIQKSARVGKLVFKGQIVGIRNNTGSSTGNHLHYSVVDLNQPQVDWWQVLSSCNRYRRNRHTQDPAEYTFANEEMVAKGVVTGEFNPKRYAKGGLDSIPTDLFKICEDPTYEGYDPDYCNNNPQMALPQNLISGYPKSCNPGSAFKGLVIPHDAYED